MSDRLTEALEDWVQEYVWLLQQHAPQVTLEPLEEVIDAARAYRDLLANGQREPDYEAAAKALNQEENERVLADRPDLFVTWEELPDRDKDKFMEQARRATDAAIGDKLLIDPPTEEE